jgi:hypothetical protein
MFSPSLFFCFLFCLYAFTAPCSSFRGLAEGDLQVNAPPPLALQRLFIPPHKGCCPPHKCKKRGPTGPTGPTGPIGPITPGPSADAWLTTGNAGTDPGTGPGQNFLGTTDNQPFVIFASNILVTTLGQIQPFTRNQSLTLNQSVYIGQHAGDNDNGQFNVFIGTDAGSSNSTGNGNTIVGFDAFTSNVIGNNNTGVGVQALLNNEGDNNTGVGFQALSANETGSFNTALGAQSDVTSGTLTNATMIGFGATMFQSNAVQIGNTAVTVIEGQVMFSTPSDGRHKTDVKETVPGLAFINKLRPVTYHIDMDQMAAFMHTPSHLRSKENEMLQSQILRTGFIAQEVEQAAQEIGYDFDGVNKPQDENDYYRLAYSSFVVPLVKAVQEQQMIIEGQQSRVKGQRVMIAELRNIVQQRQKWIDELRMTIEKQQELIGELRHIVQQKQKRIDELRNHFNS